MVEIRLLTEVVSAKTTLSACSTYLETICVHSDIAQIWNVSSRGGGGGAINQTTFTARNHEGPGPCQAGRAVHILYQIGKLSSRKLFRYKSRHSDSCRVLCSIQREAQTRSNKPLTFNLSVSIFTDGVLCSLIILDINWEYILARTT